MESAIDVRPLPEPTALSLPHWEGASEGRLMVQRCLNCREYVFIPRRVCTHCFTTELEWVESSGQGRIYSYTIIRRAPSPGFTVPYCIAIVELDEGWTMLSNITGCAMDEVEVDKRVVVNFQDFGEITLPMFRLSQ